MKSYTRSVTAPADSPVLNRQCCMGTFNEPYERINLKEVDWKLKATRQHTKEEGENLKRLLEAR